MIEYDIETYGKVAVHEDDHLLILTCIECGQGLVFSVRIGADPVQAAIDAHLRLHQRENLA